MMLTINCRKYIILTMHINRINHILKEQAWEEITKGRSSSKAGKVSSRVHAVQGSWGVRARTTDAKNQPTRYKSGSLGASLLSTSGARAARWRSTGTGQAPDIGARTRRDTGAQGTAVGCLGATGARAGLTGARVWGCRARLQACGLSADHRGG